MLCWLIGDYLNKFVKTCCDWSNIQIPAKSVTCLGQNWSIEGGHNEYYWYLTPSLTLLSFLTILTAPGPVHPLWICLWSWRNDIGNYGRLCSGKGGEVWNQISISLTNTDGLLDPSWLQQDRSISIYWLAFIQLSSLVTCTNYGQGGVHKRATKIHSAALTLANQINYFTPPIHARPLIIKLCTLQSGPASN